MADMFGAPIGIGAAEADQRQNVLGGLQALKQMGEIAAQPQDLALKKAHTRLYEAEAGAKERELAAEEALGRLAAGQRNTPVDPEATPGSRAVNLGEQLMGAGYFSKGLKVVQAGVGIDQKAAAAMAAQASAELRRINGQRKQLENMANLAQGVLNADTPEAYAQARLYALEQGMDASRLPEVYNANTKTVLQQVVAAGTKASEQLKLKEDALTGVARRAQLGASAAASSARVKVLQERERALKDDFDRREKTGGKYDPKVAEYKDALRDVRRAKLAAEDLKNFPPAPARPEDREPGKTYTAANGAKFKWMNGPEGKPVAQLLKPPPLLQAPGKATAAASDDGDDSESDDDGDD